METVNTISVIIFIAGMISLLLAIMIAIVTYHKRKITILRMRRMLDEAIDGTFTESIYNESLYSAVENNCRSI